MDEPYLYQQIADSIRGDILSGRLKPGDRLPSLRALREQWNCTPGTIQRAYQELAREGLVISRGGRGTQVSGSIPEARAQAQGALRVAQLVHRSETFLLEALTAGYTLREIQSAVDLAMDRWRALETAPPQPVEETLRFAGSHDLLISAMAHQFFGKPVGANLDLTFIGSQAGLDALAARQADLAGCHLWDPATGAYNLPAIHKTLPRERLVVVTLAHRRLGLITAPGNPLGIHALADLTRAGVRFVNRQPGSGTRVWLDASLERLGLSPRQVVGYRDERLTHSDVARAVAEYHADVGLGLETAAAAYDLHFIMLARERYDLVMREKTAAHPAVRQWIDWLGSADGQRFVTNFVGYDPEETGRETLLDGEPERTRNTGQAG